MKLKFQLKGLVVQVEELPNGISVTILSKKHRPAESQAVSPQLRQRINSCKSLTELLGLLFTTTEKSEAVMALFDRKMEALEKEGFSIVKPFKTNNNGSASS